MEIFEQLRNQHEPTALLYRKLVDDLSLSPERHRLFDEVVVALLESGWHGYEVVSAWLEVAPQIVPRLDESRWMEKARVAVGFAALSVEPAKMYWRAVAVSVEHDRGNARLSELESLGLRVQKTYQFSAQILTLVLQAGVTRLSQVGALDFEAWRSLTTYLLTQDRELLVSLLSETQPLIDEVELIELLKVNPQALVVVLSKRHALVDALPGRHFELWWQVLLLLAESEGDVERLIDGLCGCPRRIGDGQVLRALISQVREMSLAVAMLAVSDKLPLDRPGLCSAWVEEGMALYCQDRRKGLAYFELASATSTDRLDALKGQVRFDEQERVLALFAEAISGQTQQLVIAEDDSGEKIGLAAQAVTSTLIVLPETYAGFEHPEGNFEFYLSALMHQLGYQLFGTLQQLEIIMGWLRQQRFPRRLGALFSLLEAARIDWQLAARFEGGGQQLARQKQHAIDVLLSAEAQVAASQGQHEEIAELAGRYEVPGSEEEVIEGLRRINDAAGPMSMAEDPVHEKLFSLLLATLDCEDELLGLKLEARSQLDRALAPLKVPGATAKATLQALLPILRWVGEPLMRHFTVLPTVDYRRVLPLQAALAALPLIEITSDDVLTEEDYADGLSVKVNPEDLMLDDMTFGEVDTDQAMLMTELSEVPEIDGEPELSLNKARQPGVAYEPPERQPVPTHYYYDEWDYHISDYRRRWCRLIEIHDSEEDASYYRQSVAEHLALQKQVRRQLSRLKPELLVKVRGSPDGEDMDLEKAIEAVIDRRAGKTPSDRIYVERHRQGRDVAALFLVDLSASTDDRIPDANAEPEPPIEYHDFDWSDEPPMQVPEGDKIIDLEKHAVIQMAQALEALGDHYAVCGFSGYGREQVEYTVCKRFNQPLDATVKAKIGGLTACRSTRMGPAIRHAAMQLGQTDARIKALIVISDGYPQDHDYGQDRNDREYGIHDTMKALQEAKQQGVQSFCLTVDPSGHDYLRLMCPDRQYMVIQDVTQLPNELSKVYRSLTG